MKTLVIFYSYTGSTEKLAQGLAAKESADIIEVKDQVKPGKFAAYTLGCFKAMRMKPSDIEPLEADFTAYEKIILMAPVWAGKIAPPLVRVFEMLPPGRALEVIAVSASGKSRAKDDVSALLNSRGCKSVRYKDIKAHRPIPLT